MIDQARSPLAKGVNPHSERKRKRHAIVLAGEQTFMAVYELWLAHRRLSLEEGRQTSLERIGRVFKKDVFPSLKKLRTWFTQLFTYTTVAIPNMGENPSRDLEVVALPLRPVEHNPFLRMHELPVMLQTLRKYRGRLNTQLG